MAWTGEPRVLTSTLVAFGVSAEGKPYLSALSKDQKETVEVEIDDLDVALLAERAVSYLAEKARRK